MVKIVSVVLMGLFVSGLHAEEKTCAVKGMHCEDCKEMVKSKVCDDTKYSKCDVKVLSAKKEIGEIHLVTKDDKAMIDESSIGAAVKDAGYTLEKCTMGKAKAEKAGKAKG